MVLFHPFPGAAQWGLDKGPHIDKLVAVAVRKHSITKKSLYSSIDIWVVYVNCSLSSENVDIFEISRNLGSEIVDK